MPYNRPIPPAPIDKVKEGSFGASSNFTTVKKVTAISNIATAQPATVKTSITNARASGGVASFSTIKAVSAAIAPAVSSKINKVSTAGK